MTPTDATPETRGVYFSLFTLRGGVSHFGLPPQVKYPLNALRML